jgi:D-alanine-D-alanine ligase
MEPVRVGVIFGGRSGEHEVSLASAASVIAGLERNGHRVVPIGITRDGRFLLGGDPLRALAAEARVSLQASDAASDVKKALAGRAESTASDAEAALATAHAGAGLPPAVRDSVDVIVVMLHGPYGEDGTVQGLLELADLPYVGAGVLASAVGMDKAMMKTVFQAHGLPIVAHEVVLRREWRRDPTGVATRVARAIGFPCFVKPSNMGSSVGISKVTEAAALPAAMDEAARHDRKVLVERGVVGAREVEVSVLGNDEPIASLPGEITYAGDWYDYATKYGEGQARVVVPAPISPALTARARELAVAAFRAIDCAGMARVDLFLDGERLLVNEINTIPGFTATSGYARMWEASGIGYGELLDRLLALALERHREK